MPTFIARGAVDALLQDPLFFEPPWLHANHLFDIEWFVTCPLEGPEAVSVRIGPHLLAHGPSMAAAALDARAKGPKAAHLFAAVIAEWLEMREDARAWHPRHSQWGACAPPVGEPCAGAAAACARGWT